MSLAARLEAVIKKFGPARPQTEKSGGSYRILTLSTGAMRVEIVNEDGDRLGASGATIDEALANLEKKVQ
jgi:hypothetical protein